MKKNLFFFILLFAGNYLNAQSNFIQNIYARNYLNLDGRWHYIIDPFEIGFRGFQGAKADENDKLGGFFENKQQPPLWCEVVGHEFSTSGRSMSFS